MRSYLEELQRQMSKDTVSMTKHAAVSDEEGVCPQCGRNMADVGAIRRCDCGYVKMAATLEDLQRQTPTEAKLSPAGGVVGGMTGVGIGADLGRKAGGTPGAVAGGAVGGLLGLVAGSHLGELIASIVQKRREIAQHVARSQPSMVAPQGLPSAESLALKMRTIREKTAAGRYIPIGRGIPGISAPSAVPVGGKAYLLKAVGIPVPTTKHVSLLPTTISPAVGISLSGLHWGVSINRRPDSVKKDSVVGKGLDNQRVGAGASVELKDEKQPQDLLMGHEKLNPEASKGLK